MPTAIATASADLEKGDLVWFDPGVGYVLPGEVVEYHRAGQVVTIQAVIAGKPQVFTLTSMAGVKRRQDLGHSGLEDMIQLNDLNEASLLWNLKIRYDKELIYTYTGSILVAVNPYKMFDIYGLDMVKKYEGQIMGTLPPHLFSIGSSAYSRMSKDMESQVVVISGESGSGKTESTKLVMQYLAAVNKSPSNLITEQILEASPLLESFGNAKTVRNDNSSRFGKYLEVHFKHGVIVGAKITEYLLEKSRIVTQAQDERNYHVFYEMLKGLTAEQKEKYGLLTAEKYFYLNQGGSCDIDGKNDKDDFQSLLSAMQVLGFTSEEQDTIFRILTSVLHLGNVYFHRKQLKHGQEGVEIGSDAEIRWAGHLLQLSVDGIKRSITMKTTEARNERLLTPLSIDQALDARDAFAKALYSALFSWLVARINQIVCKGGKRTAISILDIFGFEDFKENSFEQLCINYANENLQFYFNKHIFKLEQQEYSKEKIEWQTITYTDNLPVINLIAKKPLGILHLLDDESNFPKATDVSFLEKCHYNHALNELYSRPRMSSMEFGVRHYAGQVWYNVEGFLDKNRDTLRQEVVELLINSKIPMVSRMFQALRTHQEATKTLNKANGRFVTMKPRTPTVAARFHDSLQQLLESMSKCNPWFVRCIKPNNEKTAMKFDMPIVLEQLRYTGMLETIRIRKTGYPVRMKFNQFLERYRYLLGSGARHPQRGAPMRELCRAILDREPGSYQLGTHRVFMRESLERRLERERADVLSAAVLRIQRNVKAYLARRRYVSQKKAAVKLQSAVRGYMARKKYRVMRKTALRAQANFRMKKQRKRYSELKDELKRRAEVEKLAHERAKVKAQKDEQERASRAVAGVNHLEIPAELAFIFSKLDDWQPVHSERNLVKVVGGVPARPDRYYLPHDIDYHAFTKFTNVYFKSHIWGMKREPIKTPFLAKSKDIDYQDSLAMFKLILRFMNDNNLSGKKEQVLGDYIVNKGIVNEKMRDEILCQLCNQTCMNDNDANNVRGWLLMANCLSCFPPSKTLYKYLLKYVSDNGYDGYKAVCQRKLLQSSRIQGQLARAYPPSLLEWRANRKRVNMALEVQFADGETRSTPVDSWTTGEELAALAIRDRGIDECRGWSVSCVQDDESGGELRDMCGFDYAMDLVSEMELAPAFPVVKNAFLVSGRKGNRLPKSMSTSPISVEIDEHPSSPRRPKAPPPEPPVTKQLTRKMSHDVVTEKWPEIHKPGKIRSQSRDHTVEGDNGLSRQSALNDRYFEEKVRSRSLDNLLGDEPPPAARKLKNMGLSQSRLNERYRSMDKMEVPVMVHNQEYMTKAEVMEEALESISQRGENRDQDARQDAAAAKSWAKFGLSGRSNLNDRYFSKDDKDNMSELGSEFNSPNIQPVEDYERRRRPPSMDNSSSKRRVSSSDFDNYKGSSSNNYNSSPRGQQQQQQRSNGHLHPNGSGGSQQQVSDLHHHHELAEFDFQDSASQARSEGSNYLRGHPRFIKSHYAGKRAAPGSHSSRAYIEGRNSEKSEYGAKSSALSDTSEAPSLASHVRRVRVPSQASDVDQFLDDLFMPVLDGNLDELSDARSLAASIKGGGRKHRGHAHSGAPETGEQQQVGVEGEALERHNETQDLDDEVASVTDSIARTAQRWDERWVRASASSPEVQMNLQVDVAGSAPSEHHQPLSVHDFVHSMLAPISPSGSVRMLGDVETLAHTIKGGGDGVGGIETPESKGQRTTFGFTPITGMTSPTPVMQGIMSGMMSPTPMMMPTIPVYTPTAAQSGMSFMTPTAMTSAGGLGSPQFFSTPMGLDQSSGANASTVPFPPTPAHLQQQQQQQQASPFMPVPIYNMQGLSLPQYPGLDVGQVAAYQQNLQRAFLQSAMAQNMQIQQQLLAQNQALQQLLHQQASPSSANKSGGAQVQDNTEQWAMAEKQRQVTQAARNIPPPAPPPPLPTMETYIPRITPQPPPPPPPSHHYSRSSQQEGHSSSSTHSFTPVTREAGAIRKSSNKSSSSAHAAFGNVLSELKTRRSSVESTGKSHHHHHQGGSMPPPPPPMPPEPDVVDPSESRPFLDPYGRAKTVRIGKWRWPPPKDSENADSFLEFKIRQHQRKSTQHQHPLDFGDGGLAVQSFDRVDAVEWEEFEVEGHGGSPTRMNSSTPAAGEKKGRRDSAPDRSATKSFEIGLPRPSPGSVGKLRISSEMRQKLEMVTANHSMRSTTKPEKPSMLSMSENPQRVVKKLEDNRKLLLEQQLGGLGGRWDTVDSVDMVVSRSQKDEMMLMMSPPPIPMQQQQQQSSAVRSQVERMEHKRSYEEKHKPAPPPPPVTPHFMDTHQHNQQTSPVSRNSSFYSAGTNQMAQPRTPPPPVQPVKRDSFSVQPRATTERRSSVSTHLTDKMERIEIEESSEFLKPVDNSAPVLLDRDFTKNLEIMKTKLYPSSDAPFFAYNRVSWKLQIRKEVFSPNETLSNPLALHLVFCQVVQDTLSPECIRISREERAKMRKMLDSYGVTSNNLHSSHHKVTIKKNIVDSAKEWPTYFARIFPITGVHQNPDVQHLAISHTGIRLIRREKSIPNDYLQVLDTFTFDDVAETSVPKGSALQIVLTTGTRYVFYTHRADQIRAMIERYIVETEKGTHEFVRALADHSTGEPSLLNFRKGEVIKVINRDQYLQKGWLYGSVNGRSGVFPCDHVEALARNEAVNMQQRNGLAYNNVQNNYPSGSTEQDGWTRGANFGQYPGVAPVPAEQSMQPMLATGRMGESGRSNSLVHDGRHSLLQFAMLHFRQSPEKFEMLKTADGSISGSLKVIENIKNKKSKKKSKDSDWTWKEQVDLVKFSPELPKESLLRLDPPELSDLAVECFASIMRYMGDLAMPADVTEVKCVYTILMHCHKHEALRDEVYCQIMKQTTNNKSHNSDSCQRGWRLFSILAAYFVCSDTLKPYLYKYLETAAYDKRRAYHGTATVCLQNLRKTFKYGGRKNVPSVEEITAISAGRNSKRQIYRLPGGTERVINTKSTTVVQDIIEEICGVIGVRSPPETEEFSLYCIVEGDAFTMPLAREEYVLDVTTELHKNQQVFYLIFCRSVWYFPMRLDSPLYVEVVFNQVAPDYLEGLLLVMPGEQLDQELVYDIAKVAALLHRAADMSHVPAMKETKFLLPRPALAVRDIKPPQWVNMVQGSWQEVESLSTVHAKAQVLDILQKWPLFGSSFFAVKRVSDPKERSDHILALNRQGVHFLDLVTHETLMHYPFSEVISTRKVKTEDGILFLDMKCGNLMQQRITRLQTDQAHEISRLIRQYITMEQRQRGGDNPADVSLNPR